MPTLFPQIDRLQARQCLREYLTGEQKEFSPRFAHPGQKFSPLGGSRAHVPALRELREGVVSIARRAGWPGRAGDDDRRRLDRELARYLHEKLAITANEASKPGVWQFLCCVVFPDVVSWRFPPGSERAVESRFMGGNRNALGRLWWRAEVLQDPHAARRYHVLDELQEDEFVQIMERPSIARSRPVARALAKSFITFLRSEEGRRGTMPRMRLMRDAAKRILRTGAVIAFDVLDEEQAAAFSTIELAHARKAMLDRRSRLAA